MSTAIAIVNKPADILKSLITSSMRRRKELTLPQKVFVVKNYYQITDMSQVLKSFLRNYNFDPGNVDIFYSLVTTFEKTGSVQQPVYCNNSGKVAVEAASTIVSPGESKKRGRKPKIKQENYDQGGPSRDLDVGGAGDEYMYAQEKEEGATLDPIAEATEYKVEVADDQQGGGGITIRFIGSGDGDEVEVLQGEPQDYKEQEGYDQAEQEHFDDDNHEEEDDSDEDYAGKPPPVKRSKTTLGMKKRVSCRICEKTYTKEFLRSHMRKHDREGCSYECTKCDETFSTFLVLLAHEESHIPVTNYKFACETCKEVFVSREKLNLHAKTHAEAKSYICEWCGMIFTKPDSLKVHIRTHTGEKPMKCKECHESFAFYGALKSHMRKHTEGAYKCQYCDKTFIYKAERNLHHRQHTEASGKPFVCHICSRACATSQNLRSHLKILHKVMLSLEEIEAQNYVRDDSTSTESQTVTYVLTEGTIVASDIGTIVEIQTL